MINLGRIELFIRGLQSFGVHKENMCAHDSLPNWVTHFYEEVANEMDNHSTA